MMLSQEETTRPPLNATEIVAQTQLVSYIDNPSHHGLHGWAYFPTAPGVRADLNVFIDGKLVLAVTADQFREDLVEARIGDGWHSFSVALPAFAEDGRVHVVRIVDARNEGSDLRGSPFRLSPYVGAVQKVENGIVTGWAKLRSSDEKRLVVKAIHESGIDLGYTTADVPRQDLFEQEIGDGRYGFVLAIDAMLLPHAEGLLQIGIDDGNEFQELSGSPVILPPSAEIIPFAPLPQIPAPGSFSAQSGDPSARWLDFVASQAPEIYSGDDADLRALCISLTFRSALESMGLWESLPLEKDGDWPRWAHEPALVCFDYEPYLKSVGQSSRIGGGLDLQELYQEYSRAAPYRVVRGNALFDEFWYIRSYIDVYGHILSGRYSSGLDHFVRAGAEAGYSPTIWFDPQSYVASALSHSIDLQGNAAPIFHFLETSGQSAFSPSRNFDQDWYLLKYPQVVDEILQGVSFSAFAHYLKAGGGELGFAACEAFDEIGYRSVEPMIMPALAARQVRSAFEWFLLFGTFRGQRFDRDGLVRAVRGRAAMMMQDFRKVMRERDELISVTRGLLQLVKQYQAELEPQLDDRRHVTGGDIDRSAAAVGSASKLAARICHFDR